MKTFRNFFVVIMLAIPFCATNAQGYVTDPDLITVSSDMSLGNGTRVLQTTPFLIHGDRDVTIAAFLVLFIPEGASKEEYQWTLILKVRYDNPAFHPEWDLTTLFEEGDSLVILNSETGRKVEMTNLYGIPDNSGWLIASYMYDINGFIEFFNDGVPDKLSYTQGHSTSKICIEIDIDKDSFALPLMSSELAIFRKITDRYE